MSEQQNEEWMKEFSRMKREMINIVYGGGYRITLDSGRVLTMNSFVQYTTYSGMMEGLPTRERNDSMLNYAPESETYVLHAPRLYSDFCKMLPPDSFMIRRYAEDPLEVLPGVTCVARMESKPCENMEWNDIDPPSKSLLTLVWFQNEWAFPIDPEAMKKLKAFDWDAHAHNKGID
jgi:hypothetical protein